MGGRENNLTPRLARPSCRAAAPSRSQLTNIWNYERFGDFYKAGPHYFFNRNSGLQNQSVVYTMDSLNGTPRVFLDPNTYRADGTAALNGRSVSSTGKYYAYAIAQAGSDWSEWHIREIATGKDLSDILRWTKDGEPTWLADDSGFYYSRYPEPPAAQVLTVAALNEKIYFHKLGTPQSADKLIYERPDHPSWGLYPSVMEGSKYMMIVIYQGIEGKNTLAYVDVTDPKARVMDLIGKIEFAYSPIAATGSLVYMQTNDNAPRGRLIAIDLQHPDRANWKQIIAERPETLDSVQLVDGKLLLSYMKDAHSVAQLAALDGKP